MTGPGRPKSYDSVSTLHPAPGCHDPADGRGCHGGCASFHGTPRPAAPADPFPHHLCVRVIAGLQCRNYGVVGRHPTRAPVWTHRGPQRDDLFQFTRQYFYTPLQFDLIREINAAARDVEAGINAARTFLPTNLPANPTYRKINPADAPIMILGLTSDNYNRTQLYDAASTVIQQKLSQIQGVGQVAVGGGTLPSVRVEVNPTKLNSMGLTLQNIQSTLSLQNSHQPTGQISDDFVTADIVTNDQIFEAEAYKPLFVGYNRGAAVRLSDVADVIDSTQNIRTSGYLNGKPAIVIIVYRQPGANIIQTVDRIRAQLPSVKASISRGIDITMVLDRTTTIRASVRDVEYTLITSIVLVIVVVFLFLRNSRATLIPSVAVPVSLIATFAVMYLVGYSIDNLSLMALTISTGFVVDDAIVVIEDISRHLEEGATPFARGPPGRQRGRFYRIHHQHLADRCLYPYPHDDRHRWPLIQ